MNEAPMAREDVERLVRIETKLDQALSRLAEDREDHDEDIAEVKREADELVKRVGSLENWRYAIGAALLMGAGGTIAGAVAIVPK